MTIWDVDASLGAKTTAGLVDAYGPLVSFMPIDVVDESSVARATEDIASAHGGLDILVNNAGIASDGGPYAIDDLPREAWARVLEVNLTGVFLCSKHAVRRMKHRGEGGSIVNVASTTGLVGLADVQAYGASKHGVAGLTKALALELVP